MEIRATKHDIRLYVTAEVKPRILKRRLRLRDLGLKGDIVEALINRARGMFRWAVC